MTQKAIWLKHAEAENASPAMLTAPAQFQLELARFLDLLLPTAESTTVEAGSEFGVTSFLLQRPTRKVLIDYNQAALAKARELWVDADEGAAVHCGDMFELSDELRASFDLVFNAGVIEHYTFDERVRLIEAMCVLAKPGSPVVIAFPNHYSIAYRAVYLLRNLLSIWRFPPEYKLYDLSRECAAAQCTQVARVVLADQSVFPWSDPWYLRWLKPTFRALNRISKLEGYLTVCVLR